MFQKWLPGQVSEYKTPEGISRNVNEIPYEEFVRLYSGWSPWLIWSDRQSAGTQHEAFISL